MTRATSWRLVSSAGLGRLHRAYEHIASVQKPRKPGWSLPDRPHYVLVYIRKSLLLPRLGSHVGLCTSRSSFLSLGLVGGAGIDRCPGGAVVRRADLLRGRVRLAS
jgi:hypothetical protein